MADVVSNVGNENGARLETALRLVFQVVVDGARTVDTRLCDVQALSIRTRSDEKVSYGRAYFR